MGEGESEFGVDRSDQGYSPFRIWKTRDDSSTRAYNTPNSVPKEGTPTAGVDGSSATKKKTLLSWAVVQGTRAGHCQGMGPQVHLGTAMGGRRSADRWDLIVT